MTTTMNIYLTGVGGQGIGLISEILLRAADHAGFAVKAVDTHGLAQRGGIVVSQLRIGTGAFSPLIRAGNADMVISLERHEALRAANEALRNGGVLVYYDTVWQPLDVRRGKMTATGTEDIESACRQRDIRLYRVFEDDLEDARMQNIAVLAHIDRQRLIDGMATEHYRQAMDDLMTGAMLEKNRALFDARCRPA